MISHFTHWTLHHGKLIVIRQIFISGAKKSTFREILSICDQFERILDIFLQASGIWSHRGSLEKGSRQHAGIVHLVFHSAVKVRSSRGQLYPCSSFTDEMSLHGLIFTSSLKLSQILSLLNKLSLFWQARVKSTLSLNLSNEDSCFMMMKEINEGVVYSILYL